MVEEDNNKDKSKSIPRDFMKKLGYDDQEIDDVYPLATEVVSKLLKNPQDANAIFWEAYKRLDSEICTTIQRVVDGFINESGYNDDEQKAFLTGIIFKEDVDCVADAMFLQIMGIYVRKRLEELEMGSDKE